MTPTRCAILCMHGILQSFILSSCQTQHLTADLQNREKLTFISVTGSSDLFGTAVKVMHGFTTANESNPVLQAESHSHLRTT